jgi:hypothetical protein
MAEARCRRWREDGKKAAAGGALGFRRSFTAYATKIPPWHAREAALELQRETLGAAAVRWAAIRARTRRRVGSREPLARGEKED